MFVLHLIKLANNNNFKSGCEPQFKELIENNQNKINI